MKKTLLFFIAAGALMMASCTKDVVAPVQEETTTIKLNLNISGPGADTKAAKKAWVSGDKLNIWFDVLAGEQTVPDLIITYDGSKWTAGTLRAGCTPNASGKILFLYEGYNDVTSAHYDYMWNMYSTTEWFSPKQAKEKPDSEDSYCIPLVFCAENIDYSFSANTLTATIDSSDWRFKTMFKVLIKTHASMDKAADYYNLQVYNTTASLYADSMGSWTINPDDFNTFTQVGTGSSNEYGWTGGVQEADGIAFYYIGFIASSADITFTLKEYGGASKTYSVTNKDLDATFSDRCVGVALNYGNFAE